MSIDKYSFLLERTAKRHYGVNCGEGWLGILERLVGQLDRIWDGYRGYKGRDAWEIQQVKEKMGTLAFYTQIIAEVDDGEEECVKLDYHARVDAHNEAIASAQQSSFETCEDCGAPGVQTTTTSWIRTLCKTCGDRHVEADKKVGGGNA